MRKKILAAALALSLGVINASAAQAVPATDGQHNQLPSDFGATCKGENSSDYLLGSNETVIITQGQITEGRQVGLVTRKNTDGTYCSKVVYLQTAPIDHQVVDDNGNVIVDRSQIPPFVAYNALSGPQGPKGDTPVATNGTNGSDTGLYLGAGGGLLGFIMGNSFFQPAPGITPPAKPVTSLPTK
jgi:hypothetical protein